MASESGQFSGELLDSTATACFQHKSSLIIRDPERKKTQLAVGGNRKNVLGAWCVVQSQAFSEGRRQKAEGRRQKEEGSWQLAANRR